MNYSVRILMLFTLFSLSRIACDLAQNIIIPETTDIRGKIYTPGTEQDFHQFINRYDLAVVDFYADWCSPCHQMHKVMDSLAQDYDLRNILFIKIDTDKHHSLSERFNVRTLPTIILFVDGKPIKTLYGYHDKKSLKRVIFETFLT